MKLNINVTNQDRFSEETCFGCNTKFTQPVRSTNSLDLFVLSKLATIITPSEDTSDTGRIKFSLSFSLMFLPSPKTSLTRCKLGQKPVFQSMLYVNTRYKFNANALHLLNGINDENKLLVKVQLIGQPTEEKDT